MTIIGCDGEHVWADSQCTQDETKSKFRKVYRVRSPDGMVTVAISGEIDIVPSVINAVKMGLSVEQLVSKKSTVLLASEAGLRIVTNKDSWAEEPPIFLGSGNVAAKGAYAICGDVGESVRAACKVDLYSSGPIQRVKI